MTQQRHVFSCSLDDSLIEDIHYFCKTSDEPNNRSLNLEEILRNAIPRRHITSKLKKRL